MDRPNLTVLTHALVTKLTLEGKRATGVEISCGGKLQRIAAGREVVLSLGAMHTPKVLMLSGIVDEAELYDALITNEIAGAALDVFETEPLPPDSPLRDPRLHLRLRMFHHFASGATDTRLSTDPNVGMAGRCVQGLRDVLERNYGGDFTKMPYVVNKEAFR